MAVLEGRALTKIYGAGEASVHALRGVDIELDEGELVVLLGHSGSGKSTLLNILAALDRPTGGRVYYRGKNLTEAPEEELTAYRRRHVGVVFQFFNLIPNLTALENVELVSEIAPSGLKPADALKIVGLGDRLDHFPAQLSGGEQQRVAIARAVVKQPGLLLCDEPTGALDTATGVVVLQALKRVNRDLGTTVFLITHNQSIGAMADRVLVMADGRIVSETRNEKPADPKDISW